MTKIDQEYAKATMDDVKMKVMQFFNLKDDEVIFTGSLGKKLKGGKSGDMDCAISKSTVERETGMKTPEEWFDLYEEFAKKYGIDVDVLPKFGFDGVAFAWPIVNANGEQDSEFVQLDITPDDNLRFRGWSQYAPDEVEGEDYVKGLVRNQIIQSAAPVIDKKVLETGLVNKMDGEQPTKWERYSYSH